MNKNLNIRGFINEISYDLTMQELENLVIDYQPVILEFVVNNQYNYKAKRDYREVCELIRSDKYFKTISMLIQSEDERINPDMAYVLYSATHLPSVDKTLKDEALLLGYKLREGELGSDITNNLETDVAILISSVKAVRSYEVTPFFRAKEVENIIEAFPEVLYNAYSKKYHISQINENVISTILSKAIPDLQPEEIITATCKANFQKDMKEEYRPYASRIQAFLYKICGVIPVDKFNEALTAACKSITKFNERTNSNETLMNKYLNYKLLEAVVNSENKSTKIPYTMKIAYKRMYDFKNKYQKYSQLF